VITVFTRQGKKIEILMQSELCDPVTVGEHVRAYCHIHGSDHQRSLSINRATGWGHCFNAACDAVVLVAEWNPAVAQRLLHAHGGNDSLPDEHVRQQAPLAQQSQPSSPSQPHPRQLVLLHPPTTPQQWQQEELAVLRSLERPMRASLGHSKRARAYLAERGIPLDVARSAGVGYLEPVLFEQVMTNHQRELLQRWSERLVFPLTSLAGKGYIGRSLWHWKPGMHENEHKKLLDQEHRPRRWIKTNPAGWFGPNLDQFASTLILVEGAFDRLTLLAAGFASTQVIALVGTSIQFDWFPPQVKSVMLALDTDEAGQEATKRLAEQLRQTGVSVRIFPPLAAGRSGKDWNERWRIQGPRSIRPLYEAYTYLLPVG
jgi:hypothetical protein